MSTVINAALESIRNTIRSSERVEFVVHFWQEFRNLGMSGFRFPQIPSKDIPRAALIPLVEIRQVHIDSRLDPKSYKYVPFTSPYVQDINMSYTDLIRRFGAYGLVKVPPLASSLDEAERRIEIFDLMMKGFTGGVLQDLPGYFGTTSDVVMQLDNPIKRVKTTAYHRIDDLVKSGRITEAEHQLLTATIPILAGSANVAHRTALMPVHGVLPSSIDAINRGDKASFDEADRFLISQFPEFDTSTKLASKQGSTQIQQLAELLTSLIGNNVSPKPAAEEPKQLTLEDLPPNLVAQLKQQISSAEPGPASNVHTESIPERAADEVAVPPPGIEAEAEQGPPRCLAIAASSGQQCKNEAIDPSGLVCGLDSHVRQLPEIEDRLKTEGAIAVNA